MSTSHSTTKSKSKKSIKSLRKSVAIKQSSVVKDIIRPKLEIADQYNKYEQEADRVADQIMVMKNPGLFSAADDPLPQQKSNNRSIAIQRKCSACNKDEETIQRKASLSADKSNSPIQLNAKIKSLQGGGQALSQTERNFFEPRFNNDFSKVRIHTSAQAANTAKSINARAFTFGNNVAFATGEYSKTSQQSKKLMAHELTHVLQQKDSQVSNLQRKPLNNAIVKCEETTAPLPDKDLFSENLHLDLIRQSMFQKHNLFFEEGSQGAGVKLIQKLLLNTVCSGYKSEALQTSTGEYNSETKKAVKLFQATHTDANNLNLTPDGLLGPLTLGSMDKVLGLTPIPASIAVSPETNEQSKCVREGKNGGGLIVNEVGGGWRIANFDIDKHFIKPQHFNALRDTIVPAIKQRISDSKGKLKIRLLGGASATASSAHNLPLSKKRVNCVLESILALGLDRSSIQSVDAVGDTLSELSLISKEAFGKTVTPNDRENPLDRMVLISFPSDHTNKKSTEFQFIINCISADTLQFIIIDKAAATWRRFHWISLKNESCRFLPKEIILVNPKLLIPLVLADGPDADSKSDFSGLTQIKSISPDKSAGIGQIIKQGIIDNTPMFGKWSPKGCNKSLATEQLVNGILVPVSPLMFNSPAIPQSNDCEKQKTEKKQTCDTESTSFVARMVWGSVNATVVTSFLKKIKKKLTKKLFKNNKYIKKLIDSVTVPDIRSDSGYIIISTKKTPEEKKETGENASIDIAFSGLRLGDEGEPAVSFNIAQTTEALVTESPVDLNTLSWGVSTLMLKANSNMMGFDVPGLGVLQLANFFGCREGLPDRTLGMGLTPLGDAICKPFFEMPGFEEITCTPKEEECPKQDKLDIATDFIFKVAPLSDNSIVSKLGKKVLGCSSSFAQVNIEATTIEGNTIWRPFIWREKTPYCKFEIQNSIIHTFGLSPLAISEPDNLFGLTSELEGNQWDVLLMLSMPLPGVFTNCTRTDGMKSDGGTIVSIGEVNCGPAPEPVSPSKNIDKCDSVRSHIDKAFSLAEAKKDELSLFNKNSFIAFLNKPINKLLPGETFAPAYLAGLNSKGEKIIAITGYKVLSIGIVDNKHYAEMQVLSDMCVFNEFNQQTTFPDSDCVQKNSKRVFLKNPISTPEEIKQKREKND